MARKRKSGTGTIRQRKDGRWEGRAVVGYDDKGLPKTKMYWPKPSGNARKNWPNCWKKWAVPNLKKSVPICHSESGWTSGIKPISNPAFAPPRS